MDFLFLDYNLFPIFFLFLEAGCGRSVENRDKYKPNAELVKLDGEGGTKKRAYEEVRC
jgi:hypothetical protein